MKIIYKDFDVENITIEKSKTMDYTYNILYNNQPLELRCPKLTNYEEVDNRMIYFNITRNKSIINILSELNKKIIEFIINNNLLGKEKDLFYIEDIFKNNMNVISDGRIIWKCNIPKGLKMYDRDARLVSSITLDETIENDDEVAPLLCLSYLRITKGTVKANWDMTEVRFTKQITDCQISDVESDSEADYDEY